jgi:electron-transferring-flavoprotein dehydrogenase
MDAGVTRETMQFDVLVVGAGPAGLAAAIRLKQRAPDATVCVVEKGAEVGAHILSGAVIEPRGLDELLPDWRDRAPPPSTPAGEDQFLFLTRTHAWRLPTAGQMHNRGNTIGSLGDFARWLAQQAEALGVEIYPGFAAAEPIEEAGRIAGVVTGDMGLARDGTHGANWQPGVELRAAYTIVAEGCRGSLAKKLLQRFNLQDGRDPQTYGIGVKELWEVPKQAHRPGLVIHSVGWPMDRATYGGAFLYHWGESFVSYGFVLGLDYRNPWLSPFEEMQRLKTHPAIRPHFAGGRRVTYGARAISEGGWQAIPKLTFPGGCLIGDSAGFVNVAKIKGMHGAIKSGILAADAIADALAGGRPAEPVAYESLFRASWLADELRAVRNIRPGFAKFGTYGGLVNAALDAVVFRGRTPWTLHHRRPDHEGLQEAATAPRIDYPKPDGVLTFDRLSSVFISNTNHAETQPVHLRLRQPERAIAVNWQRFASPETRYCPAGVYEIVDAETGAPKLQINAANCVHCKTCDIKDPTQNIDWVTPEGGGGPVYPGGM